MVDQDQLGSGFLELLEEVSQHPQSAFVAEVGGKVEHDTNGLVHALGEVCEPGNGVFSVGNRGARCDESVLYASADRPEYKWPVEIDGGGACESEGRNLLRRC